MPLLIDPQVARLPRYVWCLRYCKDDTCAALVESHSPHGTRTCPCSCLDRLIVPLRLYHVAHVSLFSYLWLSLPVYISSLWASVAQLNPIHLCFASLSVCIQLPSVSHITPKLICHVSSSITAAKSHFTLSLSLIRFSLEDDLSSLPTHTFPSSGAHPEYISTW